MHGGYYMSEAKKNGRTGNTKKSAKSEKNAAQRNAVPDLRLEEKTDSESIGRDIVLLLCLVCGLVLFISNLGLGGTVGTGVSKFLYGLFGIMAFVLPFYCFFLLSFGMANKESPLIRRKMAGFILLFIFLCAFFQLTLSDGSVKDTSVRDYFYNSFEDHRGGGIIGGLITFIFTLGFSKIIAYILTAAALIISVILITQKPLVSELKERTRQGAGELRRMRDEHCNADDIYDDGDYDPDWEDISMTRASERKSPEDKKTRSRKRGDPSSAKDLASGSRKIRDIDLNSLLIEEEQKEPERPARKSRKTSSKNRSEDTSGSSAMPSFLRGEGSKSDPA